MKANTNKCHLLVTGNYQASANVNEFEIETSKKEKLLGISIDARLSFGRYVTSLFKKGQSNVASVCKSSTLYGPQKKIYLMKIFAMS